MLVGKAHNMENDNVLFSKKIRVFSFIFAAGMIGYHANATVIWKNILLTDSMRDTIFSILDKILTSMGSLGVTFFFINSAFLLYYNLNRDNMKGKIIRRLKTLGIPFLIWNVLGAVCYNLFVLNPKDSALEVICKILFSDYCGVMWFIESLLLYLLMMPLIKLFSHKIFSFIFIAFLWILLKYIGLDIDIIRIGTAEWNVGRTIYYIPTYLLGAWIGVNYSSVVISEKYRNKYVNILSIFTFIVGYAIQIFEGIDCSIVIIITAWISLPKAMFQKCDNWKWYISFYIYAIHEFILGVAIIGVRKLKLDIYTINIVQAVLWRVIMIGVTLVIAIISAWIMIRFMPKLYSVLSGGRIPDLKGEGKEG